jgi:hypothetical protein
MECSCPQLLALLHWSQFFQVGIPGTLISSEVLADGFSPGMVKDTPKKFISYMLFICLIWQQTLRHPREIG